MLDKFCRCGCFVFGYCPCESSMSRIFSSLIHGKMSGYIMKMPALREMCPIVVIRLERGPPGTDKVFIMLFTVFQL